VTQRNAVFPPNPHALYDLHRYSPAVRSGDLLFVSGQVGARADGSPEPDLAAQVQLAFDNLNAILAAAGGSFADVVDATLFMVDPEAIFETVWPVLGRNWGDKPYPTVTAVGVTWLAGFQFEIKVVARIPG
jgi:enamine deaminase RidA (YjgF/YER057c/UK114 family)